MIFLDILLTMAVTLNSDNTATFTISAPEAKKVVLDGNFVTRRDSLGNKIKTYRGGYRMHKSTNGQWTYTTFPLKPEMYVYRFNVDGKMVYDSIKPFVRDINNYYNYFFVKDSIVNHYLDCDVPHGRLQKVWYPSTLNGMSQRRMCIYTPPGYDNGGSFPVLYLLHGSGGDETSWSDYGRACQILDNMIASGEIRPMIVIMPNGNVNLDAAPGESPYMQKKPAANNMGSMFGQFEASFCKEIVDYVDKHFHTIREKDYRAIAGLSLGGLHTIYTSLNNPDVFAYVGLFSPQTTNKLDDVNIYRLQKTVHNIQRVRDVFSIISDELPHQLDMTEKFKDLNIYDNLDEKLKVQFAKAPKLYYISIGQNDFLMTTPMMKKINCVFFQKLDDAGYKHEFHLTDGDHSWSNWRRYLVDFLPKLFK